MACVVCALTIFLALYASTPSSPLAITFCTTQLNESFNNPCEGSALTRLVDVGNRVSRNYVVSFLSCCSVAHHHYHHHHHQPPCALFIIKLKPTTSLFWSVRVSEWRSNPCLCCTKLYAVQYTYTIYHPIQNYPLLSYTAESSFKTFSSLASDEIADIKEKARRIRRVCRRE